MGTFASVWPGVNVDSGTVVIVLEHLGEERTVSRRSGTAYDRARDYVGVATKIFGGAVPPRQTADPTESDSAA